MSTVFQPITNDKPKSTRPSRLTPLTFNEEEKIPKEKDFINDYFNPKICKIHDEYKDVQTSFQSNWDDNKIVKEYEKFEKFKGNKDNKVIEDNKKGNIKKNKSPGWQYTFKNMDFDKLQYSYIVDEQLVTRVKHNEDENNEDNKDENNEDNKDENNEDNEDENNEDNSVYRIIKEFVFNKSHNATLFMITLEITMQKMAYKLLKNELKDDIKLKDKVIVPKIINHYKVELDDNENYKIIIEMEYIKHKELEKDNVKTATYALEQLRNHNIFHFDTHPDNIVQTEDGKIVILDFGKAQINKNPDISSSTGLYNNPSVDDVDYDTWKTRTPAYADMRTSPGFYFYGGKKNKSKRKTKKSKKKVKSKKTKKRTYRKRK